MNKIMYNTIPRQKSEETPPSSATSSPRPALEKSLSCDRTSSSKRTLSKSSPDKSDRFNSNISKMSPVALRSLEAKYSRRISPSDRKQSPRCSKLGGHSRHTSDSGDVTAYRNEVNSETRAPLIRSASVKGCRGGQENRASILRCGCRMPQQDNKEVDGKRSWTTDSRCGSAVVSPRQRKASPSPHQKPLYRRW